MKLTYDRLREITERAENAIAEEMYLRPELEEALEEMTECWAEIERLKEENKQLTDQLQDALNTLKWYADEVNYRVAWLDEMQTQVESDGGKMAKRAIDRIQSQEGIKG